MPYDTLLPTELQCFARRIITSVSSTIASNFVPRLHEIIDMLLDKYHPQVRFKSISSPGYEGICVVPQFVSFRMHQTYTACVITQSSAKRLRRKS